MRSNQPKKDALYVQMLGGFSMTYRGQELVDGRRVGSQFCSLMEAVLYHHETGADRALLKEVLFEDRDVDDVQHAIRNVIYNAKRRFAAAGIEEDSLIEVRSGVYYWNSEVPLVLDTEEMERLYDEAREQSDAKDT